MRMEEAVVRMEWGWKKQLWGWNEDGRSSFENRMRMEEAVVRMEWGWKKQLWGWNEDGRSSCEDGTRMEKVVRMEWGWKKQLWEWKDCEDGKIVRMVVSSENMNGVQDGCKKLILISMKFALFTFLQNNICTLIFRILSTDVYSAHIFHNFPWLNKMSSFSNIILIKP